MSIEVDFSISPVRRSLPQHYPATIHDAFCLGPDFRLHIKDTVLSAIRNHATQHRSEEVGGVLLGRHLKGDNGYIVIVDDHLAVPSQSRSEVHFSFDQSSISAIFERIGGSTDYIVGWYHSHIAGTPFMSSVDCGMHRDHFPEPWYVSCVVGAGEWGVPVDFWRLIEGELVNLDEYSIDIIPGVSATQSHQRFLRECQSGEAPPVAAAYASALLPDLGISSDGVIARLLHRTQQAEAIPATRLEELRAIIDLAVQLAAEPDSAGDLSLIRDRLAGVRSFEDGLMFVSISEEFRGKVAFCGSKGLFLEPGRSVVSWFDTTRNMVWPVNLKLPASAGCFTADGTAWLAVEGKRVVRLTSPIVQGEEEEAGSPPEERGVLQIAKLAGEPSQMVAHDDDLWIRTAECWYRIPVGKDEDRVRLGAVWDLPEAQACVLVEGLTDGTRRNGPLLCQSADKLQAWNTDETSVQLVTEQALETPWSQWRLTHACLGGSGLYLLFDDGKTEHLGLFDRDSLELKWRYIKGGGLGEKRHRSEICADPFGRIYLRRGTALFRLRP